MALFWLALFLLAARALVLDIGGISTLVANPDFPDRNGMLLQSVTTSLLCSVTATMLTLYQFAEAM